MLAHKAAVVAAPPVVEVPGVLSTDVWFSEAQDKRPERPLDRSSVQTELPGEEID